MPCSACCCSRCFSQTPCCSGSGGGCRWRCCGDGGSCCSSACGKSCCCHGGRGCLRGLWALVTCWRHPIFLQGLKLLVVAALLSLVTPGAPLHRELLSEDAERQRLLDQNQQRLEESRAILDRYNASRRLSQDDRTSDGTVQVDVGVTILTMERGRRMSSAHSPPLYLTQSLASLVALLNDSALRRSYDIRVCNVDDQAEKFQEALELEELVPAFRRYKAGQKSAGILWEKAKSDYLYCLQRTLERGARYALLIEDDAVAHPQALRALEHVLETVVEREGARPVAYLKLYHPQRLLGYLSLEVERLAELLALSVSLGAVLAWLPCLHHASRTPAQALISWAKMAVMVGVVALSVGRTNLLELRRLSPQLYQVTPAPSCCTPAMLFSFQGALDLSAFLANVTCSARRPIDVRMEEFRAARGARGLLVQPNLFLHIGMVSSLRKNEVSSLIVQ